MTTNGKNERLKAYLLVTTSLCGIGFLFFNFSKRDFVDEFVNVYFFLLVYKYIYIVQYDTFIITAQF